MPAPKNGSCHPGGHEPASWKGAIPKVYIDLEARTDYYHVVWRHFVLKCSQVDRTFSAEMFHSKLVYPYVMYPTVDGMVQSCRT